MLKLVKALHLLGAMLFFGSILAHVTTGLIPGAEDDPQTALVIRQAIAIATSYLTMPGLILLLVTGTSMIVKARLPIFRLRWLTLHALFGLLIALNAALVLYPTGREALEVATQVAAGLLPIDQLHALGAREATFGPVNVLLCLATVLVAVIRPRLGKARA
ncbi:MAG: DUF2269 family protein [Geminicoccaceae bacterium]|jgi:hypothetical protein|nr:DUF2269 family protein [Geminicoccaceae bacterium]HRY24492.1 DUF2269 family protein [Geminicoccaceae bacterium]